MIKFACISPHPPIILPSIGSDDERKRAKNTIQGLRILGKEMRDANPQLIIVSSPHQDWGFDVPLHFVGKGLHGKLDFFLTNLESPANHYNAGQNYFTAELKDLKQTIALIASGDLSHRLKTNGPYGLHPNGDKFDKALIAALKEKDIGKLLSLDERYPEAGECGLRSFCFCVGILDAAKIDWKINVLSYEAPFGVGYLVARFTV